MEAQMLALRIPVEMSCCPVVHVLTALCPLLFPVTAVYDVTLNFKDQQTPTLLGIVQGKKYKADLKIK